MKYQSSSTHCSKVISKVKVFKKKALALTVQKSLARLKFNRGGQNDRKDKNNMPPDLRSRGHKNIC